MLNNHWNSWASFHKISCWNRIVIEFVQMVMLHWLSCSYMVKKKCILFFKTKKCPDDDHFISCMHRQNWKNVASHLHIWNGCFTWRSGPWHLVYQFWIVIYVITEISNIELNTEHCPNETQNVCRTTGQSWQLTKWSCTLEQFAGLILLEFNHSFVFISTKINFVWNYIMNPHTTCIWWIINTKLTQHHKQ